MNEAAGSWGALDLGAGECARAVYGPIELILHRREHEWWVATEEAAGDAPPGWRKGSAEQIAPPDPERSDHLRRHLFARSPERALVRPALADRAVIARPHTEISIPPRQSARLYAATPLWLEVLVANNLLLEVPLARPSDTWFGDSPVSGELCYAVKIEARLDREGLAVRPELAVTTVAITEARIENAADTPLALAFLRIPAPNLSLYAGDDGSLRTETIALRRSAEDEMASLEIVAGRPQGLAATAERLRSPRTEVPPRTVIRAFQRSALATLFGN